MISYDQKTIGFINVFEKSTRAQVKDCFEEDESLVFVVQPGQIGFAIGKKGANIKRLNLMFKRKIKIIEFNPSAKHFLLNLLYPLKVDIEVKEEEIVIKTENTKQKGQIFGRDRTNLKRIQAIMDKYFKLKIVLE